MRERRRPLIVGIIEDPLVHIMAVSIIAVALSFAIILVSFAVFLRTLYDRQSEALAGCAARIHGARRQWKSA